MGPFIMQRVKEITSSCAQDASSECNGWPFTWPCDTLTWDTVKTTLQKMHTGCCQKQDSVSTTEAPMTNDIVSTTEAPMTNDINSTSEAPMTNDIHSTTEAPVTQMHLAETVGMLLV